MSDFLHLVALVCLSAMLLATLPCLYRVFVGPTTADRAVALDVFSHLMMGVISVLCVFWNATLYFNAIWLFALVGFVGSASLARYLERGRLL